MFSLELFSSLELCHGELQLGLITSCQSQALRQVFWMLLHYVLVARLAKALTITTGAELLLAIGRSSYLDSNIAPRGAI